jgi:predicted GH43/DUF377 family glycosyl hydrolase
VGIGNGALVHEQTAYLLVPEEVTCKLSRSSKVILFPKAHMERHGMVNFLKVATVI